MSDSKEFIEALKLENKSAESIRTYEKALKKFEKFLQEKKLKPNSEAMMAFLSAMKRQKLSPATMRLYMVILKRYYFYIGAEFPKIKYPRVPLGPPKFIERDDFKRMYDATEGDPFLRAVLSTAYSTAMRINEIVTRKYGHVEMRSEMVDGKRVQKWSIFVSGKTGPESDAMLPLNDTAVNDLKEYFKWRKESKLPPLQDDDYLFPRPWASTNDAMFSKSTLTYYLYNLCKKVGLPKYSWHKIRHSRATHLGDDNVPIEDIKEQLRHSNIQTTMRYRRSDSERLRKKTSGKGVLT